MLDEVISTALQVGVVLLLALAVWAVFGRRRCSFPRYVGLVPTPWRTAALGLAIGLAGAVAVLSVGELRRLAGGPGTVAGEALSQGVTASAIGVLLLAAVVKTSFTEELLFRGLIGKRLIARFGFGIGNTLQALTFGAVHIALLLSPLATPPLVAAMVAFTAGIGWVAGWLNERLGGGSILPGWAAHGAANVAAYLAVAVWMGAGEG